MRTNGYVFVGRSAMLFALSIFFCAAARAQETGRRDFGGRVDIETVPLDMRESLPDIENWMPTEEFAEEVRESLFPAVSMSSVMNMQREKAPRRIYVLPNNALRVWRVTFSNGSAGNWGTPPANYLDARTLSFPTPR